MSRPPHSLWSAISLGAVALLLPAAGCMSSTLQHDGGLEVDDDHGQTRALHPASPSSSSPGLADTRSAASDAPQDAPQCEPLLAWDTTSIGVGGGRRLVWDGALRGSLEHLPDGRASMYRSADGATHLNLAHVDNARVTARTPEGLATSSSTTTYDSVIHGSQRQASYAHREWIMSPFSDDGVHFFALAHSEFYECLEHPGDRLRACEVGNNRLSSWVNAITLFVSDDGGASWRPAGDGPAHVVLAPDPAAPTLPYWTSNEPLNHGVFHPSNVVRDGSSYVAVVRQVHRTSAGTIDHAGLVMLRSDTPTDASSWHPDGLQTRNASLPLPVLPTPMSADHPSLTYNTALCRWLLMYFDYADSSLYVMSADKLESGAFSEPRRIEGQEFVLTARDDHEGGFVAGNYAHIMEPTNRSYNFTTSGVTPSLYFSSFRPDDVYRREVYRLPLVLVSRYVPPALPIGWFRIDDELFRSDGAGGFCGPVDVNHARRAGVQDPRQLPAYLRIPDGMRDDGACML